MHNRTLELDGDATTTPLRELTPDQPFSLTGDALREILARPQPPSPFPGFLDVEPSLHLLVGEPKIGKTTFALLLASAWCQGLAPWPGAPKLPGTRALILSAEQSTDRVLRVLRRLTNTSGVGSVDGWLNRISIASSTSEANMKRSLDPPGCALLCDELDAYRSAGDPIELLVLDSLSRLKPPGIDENDASHMTDWLQTLEQVARSRRVYILLLHHSGHANRPGAVRAARGSSAIGAVAQVCMTLRNIPKQSRQRELEVVGNEIDGGKHIFNVANDDDSDSHINFYRPVTANLLKEIDLAMPLNGKPMSVRAIEQVIQTRRHSYAEKVPTSGFERAKIGKALKDYEGSATKHPKAGWIRTADLATQPTLKRADF